MGTFKKIRNINDFYRISHWDTDYNKEQLEEWFNTEKAPLNDLISKGLYFKTNDDDSYQTFLYYHYSKDAEQLQIQLFHNKKKFLKDDNFIWSMDVPNDFRNFYRYDKLQKIEIRQYKKLDKIAKHCFFLTRKNKADKIAKYLKKNIPKLNKKGVMSNFFYEDTEFFFFSKYYEKSNIDDYDLQQEWKYNIEHLIIPNLRYF